MCFLRLRTNSMMICKTFLTCPSLVASTWQRVNPLCTCPVLKTESQAQKSRAHKYSERWQASNVKSTSRLLQESITYHQDGVVVLNKPPGLGSSKEECSLYDSLPFLAEELGYKYLKLVSVPEKSISGLTILAADTSIADDIHKALRRSKSVFTHEPKQSFLAVTVGHPVIEDGYARYSVAKQYKGNEKYCFISRSWGKNAVKRREVNIGTIGFKTLEKSEEASLVSISTWQLRNHCPRLFLSDILLAPALGDQKFGPRASFLFGKPILLKPWVAPAVKALPLPLLQKLHVRSGAEELIPLHLHMHELTLHNFLNGEKDLVLRAEPPDYFKWTCEQLSLALSETSGSTHIEPYNEICSPNSNNHEAHNDKIVKNDSTAHVG